MLLRRVYEYKNRFLGNVRKSHESFRVVYEFDTKILVSYLNRDHYLFHIVQSTFRVTPGFVAKRVGKWGRFKRHRIDGHVLLCPFASLSPALAAGGGENLRPNVAVVGLWGREDRLVCSSDIDFALRRLVDMAGIPGENISAISAGTTTRGQQSEVTKLDDVLGVGAAKARPPTHSDRMPQRNMLIDSYRLLRRLGRGMSAEVWRARVERVPAGLELKEGQEVAVKIYSRAILSGFQALRIQREFGIASQLNHPNLARVYDVLVSPSRPFHTFLVMEYLEGKTLKDYISPLRAMPVKQIFRIGSQLFSALRELHSVNAVHRDVKAANIMVTNPDAEDVTVKLLDFGIVSVQDEDSLTMGSIFVGSKHSAPLEQLTGEPLDHRADIYAAGTVLFHCYSGRPIYRQVGPEGAIVRRMLQRPETLDVRSGSAGSQEERLISFINRCIAVDKVDRPESAHECVSELDRLGKAF
jgi:hypothetical protein